MSLNWQMPENSSETILRYKFRYNGKEHEDIHPVLRNLIFLTMVLGGDLTGGDKAKADIKKRVAYIAKVQPALVTLPFGDDAHLAEVWNGTAWQGWSAHFNPKADYDGNGKVINWKVIIDDKWIDLYWGLSTNADRKPFTKWFNHFNKRTLELMESGRL